MPRDWKQYYQDHKEQEALRKKEYYQKNKDTILSRQKRYVSENKSKIKTDYLTHAPSSHPLGHEYLSKPSSPES